MGVANVADPGGDLLGEQHVRSHQRSGLFGGDVLVDERPPVLVRIPGEEHVRVGVGGRFDGMSACQFPNQLGVELFEAAFPARLAPVAQQGGIGLKRRADSVSGQADSQKQERSNGDLHR